MASNITKEDANSELSRLDTIAKANGDTQLCICTVSDLEGHLITKRRVRVGACQAFENFHTDVQVTLKLVAEKKVTKPKGETKKKI